MKWEYCVASIQQVGVFENTLNDYGNQRWRAIDIYRTPNGYIHITFERPAEADNSNLLARA